MSDSEASDSSDNSEQEPGPTRENINPESIEGLFLIALEKKTPTERTQFLDEMCGDNLEQRRRVEALLMAYEDAGSFLEKSPVGSHEPQPISLDFLRPSDNTDLMGTLGEYEIHEVIGQGGMGIVFRALDPKLNRIVAIKVMSPLLAVNPNSRKRFLREAQAAAAVSHPHIVTIHAVDEDKLPYLVMEYVVGQSLQEKLDTAGALQVTEILRIGTQIAEGLAAAHKQGLIHRDIKPANILLENGVERVNITDFGLARAVDDVTITKTGEVSGTPQYMSPEQATGERVDQRSDLFSLGAVLYAMCTGRSPFRASNLAAVVRRVCDDRPRPIEEVNEEIPEWLIEIVNCLLEKRPEARLQTAEEVADLLGVHLAIVQQPAYDPHDSPPLKHKYRKQVNLHSNQRPVHWIDRAAVWLGGFILLVPIFLWVIGSSGGGHFTSSVTEMVVVSLLFCGPVGLLVMVCGAQNIVQPGSTSAKLLDGLFLLGCVFAGPLGILLFIAHYLKKRDARSEPEVTRRAPTPRMDDRVAQEQSRSNKRVLRGVGIGVGLLFVIWMLSVGWGLLRESPVSLNEWLIVSISACVIVGGPFACVKLLKSSRFRTAMNSPWKIIGWMILIVPLLFCGLFVVLLIAPMFARTPGNVVIIDYDQKYPVVSISTDSKNGDNKSYFVDSRPFKLKLPPGEHALRVTYRASGETISFTKNVKKIAGKQLKVNLTSVIQRFVNHDKNTKQEVAERKQKQGAIFLERQDPGLRAGVFPDDPMQTRMDEGVFGFADRFFTFESLTHEVPAGKYIIRVSSDHAGWEVDGGTPRYELTEIEVKPGAIVTVMVQRDYAKLAKSHPDWSKGGLFKFRWPVPGKGVRFLVYTLTLPQAEVVQELLVAFAAGNPSVEELALMETANKHIITKSYASMKNLFNNGKHPAWETLIVPGTDKSTYRLAEPESKKTKNVNVKSSDSFSPNALKPADKKMNEGYILVDLVEGGFRYFIRSADPLLNQKFNYTSGLPDEDGRFKVPAGTYNVEVDCLNIGWRNEEGKYETRYPPSKIEVNAGKTVIVTIARDYRKIADNVPNWSQGTQFLFRWPVQRLNHPENYRLSKQQAKVVQQLFNAFAEGKPEVNETELLQTANKEIEKETYKSLKGLFDDGEHTAWENLIVPGKEKSRWQLISLK